MDPSKAKAVIEAIAQSKGVFSAKWIARVVASKDEDKLALIRANEELRADNAASLKMLVKFLTIILIA
jgi:hypothetical protein